MKTLVIAEKPSVARDIARVLGCSKKRKRSAGGKQVYRYLALGHLVTLKDPEDYENIKEAYAKAQDEMIQAQDRATGNYNRFWDERNYLNLVDKNQSICFYCSWN